MESHDANHGRREPRPEELTNGLWRWTARHPEWHPSGFDDEVASFALDTDDGKLAADESL